jgi:hypothetical protein
MMDNDEPTVERADRNAKTIAIHFLAGFGIGLFLAGILISYNLFFTFSPLSVQQIAIAIGVAFVLGILSALYGDRVLNILSNLLESLSGL